MSIPGNYSSKDWLIICLQAYISNTYIPSYRLIYNLGPSTHRLFKFSVCCFNVIMFLIRFTIFSLQLLEVVWGLSHVDSLPTHLINQAVQSHLDILTLSQYVTDQVRNLYIEKCIQDIRDGRWVVPAIRHLQSNLEAMLKKPYSKSHKVSFVPIIVY